MTLDTAEPSPAHPAVSVAVLCSCGHANPPGAGRCTLPTCRRMLKGNRIAAQHGIYATPSAEDAQVAAALFEQSVLDAGGREELIARELALHEYRGVLHLNVRRLARALEQHGQFDKRGRLRVGWLSKLESLVSTAVTIDKTLGLARRTKRVPTLQEWAEQHGKGEA